MPLRSIGRGTRPPAVATLLQLKEELGAKKMSAEGMPLRRALFGVSRKPEQIERRRQELQAWLWKLIADGEIARSRMLNNFLELSEAAKLVQRWGPWLTHFPFNVQGCSCMKAAIMLATKPTGHCE